MQELTGDRNKLELQQKEAEGRLQQAESGRRKLENELNEYKQRRTKSESRLATLTSTEQYQALVKEIATHGEKITALEDQILAAMERTEESQRSFEAEKVRVRQAVDAIDAQQRTLQADLEAARKSMPEETRQREAALEHVDARLRTLYDRILKA